MPVRHLIVKTVRPIGLMINQISYIIHRNIEPHKIGFARFFAGFAEFLALGSEYIFDAAAVDLDK